MADPLSLTAITAVVLTEGIKFLYGQAGEAIKRWRNREDKAAPTEPVIVHAPDVLEGTLNQPVIHYEQVAELEPQLLALRRGLSDYADGIEAVDTTSHDLLVRVDALRRLMEVVYGQSITFKGEPRGASGSPVVVGKADVTTLAGEAAAVAAQTITSGNVLGELKAERIEPGGRGYGVKVDRIGS